MLTDGVAGAARLGGVSLGAAVRLATSSPARFTGGHGVLRLGTSADLVPVRLGAGDHRLTLLEVLRRGQPA